MAAKSFFATASSFPILLALGILMRAPALWHPVEEGQRNAQTACLTANMIEEGNLRLDPVAPWRGDLQARLVQELPIYNLLVLALTSILRVPLDLAGRLVSLFFWGLGFLLLQVLWRLSLPLASRPWANLLFVLAPMSWYLSTAFMPETLVQFLSLAFILLGLQYAARPTCQNLAGCTLVGVLGLLVKFPAFIHLGLFFLLVVADRQGWRALFKPALGGGGLVIVIALLGWSRYVDAVNSLFFPDWRGWENLRGFLRPEMSRLSFGFWAPLTAYNLTYVLPVVAAPFAGVGLVAMVRRRSDFQCRIWLYLLLSLLGSWLVWAKGAAAQNYYNLPNLPVFCALFGGGVAAFWEKLSWHPRGAMAAKLGFTLLLFAWAAGGHAYLARPDHTTLKAASWIRANSKEMDLVIYQPRHMASVWDYEHQPLLSYASSRRTWVWTRSTPEWEKQRASTSSAWLVVTHPPARLARLERLRRFFKGDPRPAPTSLAEDEADQWIAASRGESFTIYRRNLVPGQGGH